MIDRGALQVVDNQVDQTTGTVQLKAEFPNADLQLWPGQFVNVRLLVDTLQAGRRRADRAPCSAARTAPSSTSSSDDNRVAVRAGHGAQQDETQAVIAKRRDAAASAWSPPASPGSRTAPR